jgi:uncharacterized 2Fe-2S/4Fe-4S cluster protein (DUF4445 family)
MADFVRIKLVPLGESVEVERGTALDGVLFRYGVEFPCGGAGQCRGCRVKVLEGTVAITEEMRGIFTPAELAEGWRLGCRATAEGPLVLEIAQWETPILSDESKLEIEPAEGLGIAVDVGSTTLVAQLLDLETGEVLAVETALNPQIEHGADIMTRVQFALGAPANAQAMADLIREKTGTMCMDLLGHPRAMRRKVKEVLLAGNSVMHHLFCGISVEPLASVPFEIEHGGLRRFSARELSWALPDDPEVSFLPCLGSFVGSDILAGILATGIAWSSRLEALIDLGTNGEIALGSRNGVLCASTAAGPAFEAGRIRMGMRAATGAIAHVAVEGGRMIVKVIGNGEPRGVCGSGLVDAVAAGLETGAILSSGRLANGGKSLPLAGAVAITQGDIRELQLAKAAIAAGLRILLEQLGERQETVKALYLAGAFGNYVNVVSARRIGLLEVARERIKPSGNTSLAGVKLVLLNQPRRKEFLERIPARVRHVGLASDAHFQDVFTDCLSC